MILAIVQARMSSTRLTGKVMKKVMGRPLISYLLERLSLSVKINKIVVATSVDPANDFLCAFLKKIGVDFYRGSEEDVLERFYQAALLYRARTIVRITADCPLIDYKIVDQVVGFYQRARVDYVSSGTKRRSFPEGMGAEVFSFLALQKARDQAQRLSEREHVTPYLKTNPGFKSAYFEPKRDYSSERWTVDYPEDFTLVKHLLQVLYKKDSYFDMQDILRYKALNPLVFQVNCHIPRNIGYLKSLKEDRLVEKGPS